MPAKKDPAVSESSTPMDTERPGQEGKAEARGGVATSVPAFFIMWKIHEVVVVLPLLPVMQIIFASV